MKIEQFPLIALPAGAAARHVQGLALRKYKLSVGVAGENQPESLCVVKWCNHLQDISRNTHACVEPCHSGGRR